MQRLSTKVQTQNLEKYTSFKEVCNLPWKTVWEGIIKPHDVAYRVSITLHHSHRMKFKDLELITPMPNPEVIVEAPKLNLNLSKALKTHFYYRASCPERSPLCLYHYAEGARWTTGKLLSNTIVPWLIQHMSAYEVWEDTGNWILPEKHPRGAEQKDEKQESKLPSDDVSIGLSNSKFNIQLLRGVSEKAIIRGAKLL